MMADKPQTDRGIYVPAMAEMFKEQAGEKYQPSNGTEGEIFQSAYCHQCVKDRPAREGRWGDSCPIIANTMAYSTTDPEYPTEWIYAEDGQPTCTAFEPDTALRTNTEDAA